MFTESSSHRSRLLAAIGAIALVAGVTAISKLIVATANTRLSTAV